ncbi:chemotaxis protein MotC [Salinarimonas soli]|uniref:Chemotaxis protein MotC n=1 Tax=Salinarimonas soli TaxID=1638099 RepID=A0A5B2VFI9_9HYPH|nr:chemotaxis protein MotC [Salinarimonas soli]KAA2237376.1 chemotaxis protein MotC [Salinarimonas soli]
MIRASLLLAAVLLGGAPALAEPVPPAPAEAPAAAEAKEPYALVRTLHALQEQIAAGDVRAHAAQRALVQHIAERMDAADPSVWQSERNARAAVAFLLSGGPPALMRRLLELDPKPRIDERLMRGALAYVEGNEIRAKAQLAEIDAKTLPAGLGAQIALVQAALVVRDDPAKAASLLALARLLAPGSLVEEAALRREIVVEGQRGNFDRFEALTNVYLRRFRQSVYAGNFRDRFGALLVGLDLERDPAILRRVEALLARFEPEGRRELLLVLARHGFLAGRPMMARRAASLAADLAPGGSPEAERAAFYGAASLVASPQADEGARALLAIDPARLPEPDRRLFEAVADLAVQVVEPLTLPPGPMPRIALGPDKAADGGADLPGSATLRRAERLLADIDTLLERSRP